MEEDPRIHAEKRLIGYRYVNSACNDCLSRLWTLRDGLVARMWKEPDGVSGVLHLAISAANPTAVDKNVVRLTFGTRKEGPITRILAQFRAN